MPPADRHPPAASPRSGRAAASSVRTSRTDLPRRRADPVCEKSAHVKSHYFTLRCRLPISGKRDVHSPSVWLEDNALISQQMLSDPAGATLTARSAPRTHSESGWAGVSFVRGSGRLSTAPGRNRARANKFAHATHRQANRSSDECLRAVDVRNIIYGPLQAARELRGRRNEEVRGHCFPGTTPTERKHGHNSDTGTSGHSRW